MPLSDSQIKHERSRKNIIIEPWDDECLGPNSYDVHLSPHFKVYDTGYPDINGGVPCNGLLAKPIDAKLDNKTHEFDITDDGYTILPGTLYLGSIVEYTETRNYVPHIDGKSSVGRLGISIHCTAGRGDAGFFNHWTLEISCIQPVIIYPGMPIGQLWYQAIVGEVDRPYNKKPNAKYNGRDPKPQASRMWQNFKNGKWS